MDEQTSGNKLDQTTATAMTTAGAGAVVSWVFQCLQAHALVTPDQTTEYVLAASLAPLLHGVKLGVQALALSWLQTKAPKALDVIQQIQAKQEQAASLQYAKQLAAAQGQIGQAGSGEQSQAPKISQIIPQAAAGAPGPSTLEAAAAQLGGKTNG